MQDQRRDADGGQDVPNVDVEGHPAIAITAAGLARLALPPAHQVAEPVVARRLGTRVGQARPPGPSRFGYLREPAAACSRSGPTGSRAPRGGARTRRP